VEGLDLDALRRAQALAAQVARTTPTVSARWLSEIAGAEVHLKCENLQRSGSFKLRGAYVRMARLSDRERSRGVVAASAGNHAQGVAVAARALGLSATVYMPGGASLPKVAATQGYGADVVLAGESVDDALAAAQTHAQRTGAVFIHPFDHVDIVAGQASVGLEILQQVPRAATILVPTGGGGLLAGVACAVSASGSDARVVGIQAEGAAAWPASLGAGHPVRLPRMSTMADGIAVGQPGQLPLHIVQQLGIPIRTVSEDALARALVLLMERSKQVVEPAGAPGVAALLEDPFGLDGPVVAVLSGGNIDLVLLQRLVRYGLAAAGRYLSLTVRIADLPGSLAQLIGVLAASGVNVLEVDHVWTDPGLAIGQVEVVVQAETRGPKHQQEAIARLREAGYDVAVAGGEG
jgi:threonine dehydratase